jgi:hypothetical protein
VSAYRKPRRDNFLAPPPLFFFLEELHITKREVGPNITRIVVSNRGVEAEEEFDTSDDVIAVAPMRGKGT